MGYGVIGSPTGSGPVSHGSSPGTPAIVLKALMGGGRVWPRSPGMIIMPGLFAVGGHAGTAGGGHPRRSGEVRPGGDPGGASDQTRDRRDRPRSAPVMRRMSSKMMAPIMEPMIPVVWNRWTFSLWNWIRFHTNPPMKEPAIPSTMVP